MNYFLNFSNNKNVLFTVDRFVLFIFILVTINQFLFKGEQICIELISNFSSNKIKLIPNFGNNNIVYLRIPNLY